MDFQYECRIKTTFCKSKNLDYIAQVVITWAKNNANIEARAKILDSKEKSVTQKRNFGFFSNFAFL